MGRAKRRMGTFLAGGLLLVTAACGGSEDSQTTASGGGGGGGGTITIKDFDYSPRELQGKVGDTITVVNADSASHSLTAEDKTFDTGAFGKETKTFKVEKPGKYTFFCTVHPFMPRGVIQVAA